MFKFYSNIKEDLGRRKDELCDVCLRANQTHMSFPISDITVLNNFDLIHWDICGTHRVKAFCGAHYFCLLFMMQVEMCGHI